MAYLLDTVALVRWWTSPEKLGAASRALLERSDADIFVSAVSVWEIANKNRIGKMPEIVDFEMQYPVLLSSNGFVVLELSDLHAMRGGYLPGTQRDPFDRLLAGQALVEDMTIVTNDPEIAKFGCKVLW